MSETRKYRKFTPQQKLELVMASWRGERSIAELCREHDISESLLRRWREQMLEAGMERFAAGEQRSQGAEQRRRIAELERARPQDLRAGDRGQTLAGLGVGMRVTRSRELVAEGYRPSVVARVAQISRQAIYRVPRPRRAPASPAKPPVDEVEAAIVEVAMANPTDGYRLVCAWARRRLGRPVNRKRVLRVMRERRLIQRRRRLERRRRPGFFRVERPDQLWHLDMTSVWVAAHGWVYLMAAIDCCTCEIVAWHLETRCRAREAIRLIERAAAERGIPPGTLTLGTDNGSAFTARAFKTVLAGLGVAHRRGGYRDPVSPAFIESWFGKLKQRCVWRHEFETLDQAREVIGAYVIHYHHRPDSRLDYRTPLEVAATWNDGGQTHLIPAA